MDQRALRRLIGLISIADVGSVWPELRQSLLRVKEKTGELWTPEFIRSRIESGHAGLFEFIEEARLAFLVVERYDQGEEPWANVWVIEGSPGLGRAEEMVRLVDGLMRCNGISRWRFTGRKGWGRLLGLKPVAVVFEREVL